MAWEEEYLILLATRDASEHKTREIYRHYSKLAARLPSSVVGSSELTQPVSDRDAVPTQKDTWTRLQHDLWEAQKQRRELHLKMESASNEVQELRTREGISKKHVADLEAENAVLAVRLRDRVEELRGKSKLLENLHNESVAMNLQLNLLEERNVKLDQDNQQLVDRWMARKGQEADTMNRELDP